MMVRNVQSPQSVLSPLFTSDLPAVRDNKDVTEPSRLGKIFSHDYWGVNIPSDRSHKENILSVSLSLGLRVPESLSRNWFTFFQL